MTKNLLERLKEFRALSSSGIQVSPSAYIDILKSLERALPEIIQTLERKEEEIKSRNESIGDLFTVTTSLTNKIMELREAQRLFQETIARQQKLLEEAKELLGYLSPRDVTKREWNEIEKWLAELAQECDEKE